MSERRARRARGLSRNVRIARDRARQIIESPEYFQTLQNRAKLGTLPSIVEVMLWHYSYGKPHTTVTLSVTDFPDVATASEDELQNRVTNLLAELRAARLTAAAEERNEVRGIIGFQPDPNPIEIIDPDAIH